MATVFDIAAYILQQRRSMTTWKLQKLVFYSQAWYATFKDHKLFEEPIQAWADGPVSPDLYQRHRGLFEISTLPQGPEGGSADALSQEQKDVVDKILAYYGDKKGKYLSDLTHLEAPWRDAREGVPAGVRCENEITVESMVGYYGSL